MIKSILKRIFRKEIQNYIDQGYESALKDMSDDEITSASRVESVTINTKGTSVSIRTLIVVGNSKPCLHLSEKTSHCSIDIGKVYYLKPLDYDSEG